MLLSMLVGPFTIHQFIKLQGQKKQPSGSVEEHKFKHLTIVHQITHYMLYPLHHALAPKTYVIQILLLYRNSTEIINRGFTE